MVKHRISTAANVYCIYRKRKIKCDETKPSCRKCSSTGRKCDGYSSTSTTGLAGFLVVLRNPGVPQFEAQAEQALQFFCEVSGPSLTNFGSARFWNGLVLQACHSELSIKHLAIAVSTLDYQDRMAIPSTKFTESSHESNRLFLQHYTSGLKFLTTQSQQNVTTEVIVVCCLLLIVCEELRNNAFAALQHVVAGRRIISDYCETRSTEPNATMQELGAIFGRLGYCAGDFDIENKIYGRTRILFGAQQTVTSVPENLPIPRTPESPAWTNIEAGVDALQRVVALCMRPPQTSWPPISSSSFSLPPRTQFQSVEGGISEELNRWAFDLGTFTVTMDDDESARHQPRLLLLKNYYLCMTIISRCIPFRDETLFDGYTPNFQHLLNTSYMLLQQELATGLVPVLFFVATRCRDPALRRRAMSYLHQCLWEGVRLSTIADRVIKLEERGMCDSITCSGEVLEERRVVVTDGSFSDKSLCTLHLIRPSKWDPPETLYHTFKWIDVHDDDSVACSIVQLLRRTLRFEPLQLN
ncbi:hypothetical protein LTR10_020054 [Elasticomyces elasticus]|uniref:Zn(2)-C6 fungal-type domain-containing protein n=1 Tax=Exophiala sideris TaxID=1016849 RepID=A0ABR0JN75_9EURO|nr:hypothetical protein LTR10_020054 [Elasticomyces elasticus]KAK5037880.1 hypothetical protein LTS07_001347 [Exophiala sideris]KAK5043863.1 hypothetical protein LTR13_000217 [Exophiala sideris]KAK5067362.1 hypothetical protein LTR69_001349 [Exophiala sideris]KAK5182695.1 hypothetical protein LTR44_005086 [Eurotiomycetes sp. CCFEE 6388]